MYATEEQARILREAVAATLLRPDSFDMSMWANHCGTVCCLAGQVVRNAVDGTEWLLLVEDDFGGSGTIRLRARKMLSLTDEDEDRLCYLDNWPVQFVVRWTDDDGAQWEKATPELLAARIDHWIEHGE